MNFLAHTFLSGNNVNILLGNFMGDFINGSKWEHLPDDICTGIKLHRGIDKFTDAHPMIRQGVKRLYKDHGKYAPVVIDILYDHILAVEWDEFTDISLREHSDRAYTYFESNQKYFPRKLQSKLFRMIEDDFLFQYRSRSGLERSLGFMDRRTKFPSAFTAASEQLYKEWDLFLQEFRQFMPDIMTFVSDFLSPYPSK